MLYEVMKTIHNFFEVPNTVYGGGFKIEHGSIVLDFLKQGQYFRIIGSVFNDGVYCYDGLLELTDEEFEGFIVPLAIPKDFLKLVADMSEWQKKNGDAVSSPYVSESFGGYSYSKGSGNAAGSGVSSVYDAFKGRLKPWRKI